MPGPPGPPGEGPQIPMEALFQVSTTKGPRSRRSAATPDVIEQTLTNGKGDAATNTLTGKDHQYPLSSHCSFSYHLKTSITNISPYILPISLSAIKGSTRKTRKMYSTLRFHDFKASTHQCTWSVRRSLIWSGLWARRRIQREPAKIYSSLIKT